MHTYMETPNIAQLCRCAYSSSMVRIWVYQTVPSGSAIRLPFCSAVVTDGGTIYVSGSIGAQRGADGKPMIVPGTAMVLFLGETGGWRQKLDA